VSASLFRREHCDVCKNTGSLPAAWVLGRDRACTCGAGPGELVFHHPDCDGVSCPFCYLLREGSYL
jgi:hypothetical protein